MGTQYVNDPDEEVAVDEGQHEFRPPVPVYSLVLIASFVAVTAVQLLTNFPESTRLIQFDKHAFVERHEYWRILTGAAAHGGVLHVLMNGYAMYTVGRIFEMLSSGAQLAIVFVLSAVGGGLLSLVLNPYIPSVGASGGIMGMIGFLTLYAFRRRQFISPEFRKSLLMNIGFILLYGLLLYQVIDNYGHIGGLVTGVAYAFVTVPSDPYADPRAATRTTEAFGIGAMGVYIAGCAFSILLMLGVIA